MLMPYGKIPSKATLQPSKFMVSIPESRLNDFQMLLKLSKVGPLTYEGAQQDRKYGVTHEWIVNAKEQWEKNFDWRSHEEKINAFPQFTVPIRDDDGLEYTVHFVGLFSEKDDATPIVLLHGWPGSFLEFLPMLSLVKEQYTPTELPYHFVVPSLPGYAFSSGPPLERDFHNEDATRIIDRLLVGLGFGDGYIAQGGDVGAMISKILSTEHAACKAIHLNMFMGRPPAGFSPASVVDPVEQQGLGRGQWFEQVGMAYVFEHATRPSTISHALSASPLALLSWIGEKFLDWTDQDLPLDTILESVTLYWLTETYPRSLYPYRDVIGTISGGSPKWHFSKPFGFSWFPKELGPIPKAWIEDGGNLVFFRRHEKGGHFAAMEQPEVLKKDLFDFVAEVWPSVMSGGASNKL